MTRLLALLAIAVTALGISGCVADPESPFIPAWKGVPGVMLAPNSQEAYGWRKQQGHYSYEVDMAPSGPPIYPRGAVGEALPDEQPQPVLVEPPAP